MLHCVSRRRQEENIQTIIRQDVRRELRIYRFCLDVSTSSSSLGREKSLLFSHGYVSCNCLLHKLVSRDVMFRIQWLLFPSSPLHLNSLLKEHKTRDSLKHVL